MSEREYIIDFANGHESGTFMAEMRKLRGKQRITICRYSPRRTDRQNRYYWPCFATALAEYMQGQGEAVTPDDAHEILKSLHLSREVVELSTGQVLTIPGSTATLTTIEFNAYLDRCAVWLAQMGIPVPDPDIYRERETSDAEPTSNPYQLEA